MDKVGAFDHTRAKLRALKADCEAEIASLGGHPALAALLDRLDRQITDAAPPPDGAALPPPPGSPPAPDPGKAHFDAL